MKLLLTLCTCAVILTLSFTLSFAGGGTSPSVDSCNDLGFIDCKCYICDTGEYKGKVSVMAEYDPEYDDCMKKWNALTALCARAYNYEKHTAASTWEYKLGRTTYKGITPKHCEDNIQWKSGRSGATVFTEKN